MEHAISLKRLALLRSEPHMPVATEETDLSDGRTLYPQIDPPFHRVKEYHRREASINLSTERSVNLEPTPHASMQKLLLFPMPGKPQPKPIDLSIGDLSRKNTESAQSDNQNVYEGGEQYEQGQQASVDTESTEVKTVKFKKFQSHSQLPAMTGHYRPESEAQLRMQQRYLNSMSRDLRLKQEEMELIDGMHAYNVKKARITRNAFNKVEAKKLFDKNKRTDEYMRTNGKLTENRMRSSLSLPHISQKKPNNVIDISSQQPVEVTDNPQPEHLSITRKEEVGKLRESLQNVLKLSGQNISDAFLSNMLKGSISSAKFYGAEGTGTSIKPQFEESMQLMKVIETNFRKKGIDFDAQSLKKALLSYNISQKELSKFPDSALVSNPYYKRWGL